MLTGNGIPGKVLSVKTLDRPKRAKYIVCPECREKIGPSENQGILKRVLGFHRYRIHGIRSPKYEQAKAYREAAKQKRLAERNGSEIDKNPLSGIIQTKPKRTYTHRNQGNYISQGFSPLPNQPAAEQNTHVVPAYLNECPCCKTRFYMAKSGQ